MNANNLLGSKSELTEMIGVLQKLGVDADPYSQPPDKKWTARQGLLLQKAVALFESWGPAQGVVYPSEVWEQRHQAQQDKMCALYDLYQQSESQADDVSDQAVLSWAEETGLLQPCELQPMLLTAGDVLSVCELALEFVGTQTANREPAIAVAA